MAITEVAQLERLYRHPYMTAFRANFKPYIVNCTYPKEYEAFTRAIAIRSRRKRICYIYDNACDLIDEYNDKNGIICSFEKGRCRLEDRLGAVNGCCCHCIYQSDKGCPSRNLTCKLFFCDRLKEKHPPVFEDFKEFRLLTRRQQYMIRTNYYCKRDTFLRLLNIGSIMVFFIYSIRKSFDMLRAERINRKYEAAAEGVKNSEEPQDCGSEMRAREYNDET